MSVYDLKEGESGKITNFPISGGAAARLNSMGITAGKRVTVLAFSLFRSGVLISCGAVRLGLRKSLALKMEVEKCV